MINHEMMYGKKFKKQKLVEMQTCHSAFQLMLNVLFLNYLFTNMPIEFLIYLKHA